MRNLILILALGLLTTPASAVQWDVLREDSPDEFTPVTEQLSNTTLIKDIAVYDDGFPADGSGWGDDESNAISAQQAAWQAADKERRAFSCSWHQGAKK